LEVVVSRTLTTPSFTSRPDNKLSFADVTEESRRSSVETEKFSIVAESTAPFLRSMFLMESSSMWEESISVFHATKTMTNAIRANAENRAKAENRCFSFCCLGPYIVLGPEPSSSAAFDCCEAPNE